MTEALSRHLNLADYAETDLTTYLSLPDALDCRSRINRWLTYSLQGKFKDATSELEDLKRLNFFYPYMGFYEEVFAAINKNT